MKITVFSALLILAFFFTAFSVGNTLEMSTEKKIDYEKFLEQTMKLRELWKELQGIPFPQQDTSEQILERWKNSASWRSMTPALGTTFDPDAPYPDLHLLQTDEQRIEYMKKRRALRERCQSFAQSEKYHFSNGILDFIWGQSYGGIPAPNYEFFFRSYAPYCNPPMELESFYEVFFNDISLDLIPIVGSRRSPVLYGMIENTGHQPQFPQWTIPSTGDSLKRLGYYESAYSVYHETAYCLRRGNSVRFYLMLDSPPLWLEVAECVYRLGKKDLAWSYLMKVGVFGKEEHLEQVKETAQFWIQCEEEGIGLPEPEKLTKEERQEIAQEIVNDYMKVNAHPRAWAFIEQYPEDFENPEKLKKEVQNAWLAVINPLLDSAKSHGTGLGEVVYRGHVFRDPGASMIVFNQQLYPDGIDSLDVKIPWAFSEGSVDRAKAMLREAMRIALLDDEPRTWRTTDGKTEYIAKFVSADEKNVTLQPVEQVALDFTSIWQPDGETITLELSNLSPDDQEYVRLRLAAEKGSEEFTLEFINVTAFVTHPQPILETPPEVFEQSDSGFVPVIVSLTLLAALVAGAFFVFRRLWL